MKSQKGFAFGGMLFFIGFVSIIAVLVLSYISAYNFGNRTENHLKAIVEQNENIYAQGTQKVMEMAQVPDMYADKVSEVTTAAIQGRYGKDGSKAVFQMLTEQNPSIDAKMYAKVQTAIEEFRNKFEENQKTMIDVKRSYNVALGSLWTGTWLSIAGYPKVDMKQFDIITTDKARQTFTTHRDSGIQLNQKK